MEFVKVAKSCAEITPEELVAKLNARENFLLVDVREPAEFEHGRIGGCIFLPTARYAGKQKASRKSAKQIIKLSASK